MATLNVGPLETYTTIQAAIDASANGDTIIVAPGTYNENITINKDITLVSSGGRDVTTIVGQGSSALGTVLVTTGGDGATIGGIGQGFTVVGINNSNPGIESAAIYLQGARSNITIQGNDVVANGDAGLQGETLPLTNLVIDSNIFSGQTFVGPTPAGNGFGTQFTEANVPRQLVVLGSNNGTSANIQFTNNQVTGTTGGINGSGQPQGNTLVTIDADNSTISGNSFTGFTNRFATQLRSREVDTDITNNSFSNANGGNVGIFVETDGVPGTYSGNTFSASNGGVITGSPGADTVTGGPGNDYIVADAGNDTIDGGGGVDTYDLSAAGTGGAFVDLNSGIAFSSVTGIDNISNIETVVGSAGNDGLYGNAADNSFTATAGADTIDGRGGSDTFNASAATSAIQINLTAGTSTGGGYGAHSLTSIENARGGSGADTFTLSTADNTIAGNGGIDTAIYSGAVTAADITFSGGAFIVAAAGAGTDTLTGVEFIDPNGAGGARILLVGGGGFTTIQAAVNAAASGDTIVIAPGTYVEQVDIDGKSDLTLVGLGEVNLVAPADVTQNATSSFGESVNALIAVENGTNVTISNINIDGGGRGNTIDGANADYVGVIYRNASGGLTDVDITGIRDPYETGTTPGGYPIVSGLQRGTSIVVDNDTLLSFSMTGGSVTDFQKTAVFFSFADLNVTGVTITGGGDQTINAQNGIQVQDSTGTISGNTITQIGYAGPAFAYSGLILGFDNTGLDILNNIITGTNGINADSKLVGIYIIDSSGGSINGNTVSFADIGIGVYGAITPNGIAITNNTVTDGDANDPFAAGVDFQPNAGLAVDYTVDGSDGNDILIGSDGEDTLSGLGGEDVIDGNGGNDILNGGDDDDTIDGGTGDDVMNGGDGNDTYLADSTTDGVNEGLNEGTDLVIASSSYTLSDNVENLTLAEISDLEDFEAFTTGPITDGENDWKHSGGFKDQEIILATFGSGTKAFRMSSDPASGDFGGPYSPALPVSAGESTTDAFADTQAITFDFRAFVPNDSSRLEVDFGNANGTDRNNFLVIENLAGGIRIAVADALPDGNFDTGSGINDFSFATGNRTLISGVDATADHQLTMVVTYVDGPDNDVVDIYLDGALIGTSTTFENYRDALGGTHEDNAAANTTSRLFFRGSAGSPNPVPTDGAGTGLNQGFVFDNIYNAVYSSAAVNGTGNELANTITGNSAGNTLSGLAGEDTLNGGYGNDTLSGGADDDTIDGGQGIDTVTFTGNVTAAGITIVGNSLEVTVAGEGTDTLTNVDIIDGGEAGRFLVVGAGGFATIQAAIDAANDGDTIIVAPGVYDEDVQFNKSVTVLGAKHGVDGDGAGRDAVAGVGETTIIGRSDITATGPVVIDGVRFVNDATTTGGGPSNNTLFIATGAGHVVTNSIFYSTVQGGANGVDDRAIMLPPIGSGSVTISDNYITGAHPNLFATASWGRGIWTDGGGVALTITGNTVEFSRTGINLDIGGTTTITISDNTFKSNGTAFSGGVNFDLVDSGITDNDFENVGTEFNLRNLAGGVSFDADVALRTLTPVGNPNDLVTVLGGNGADTLLGTNFGDVLDGNNLNASATDADTLSGRGGDDFISGKGGDDVLSGGSGIDTIDGGAGNDTIDGGADDDLLTGGTGDDTYDIDSGDSVFEQAAQGTDKVRTSTFSIFLSDYGNVEIAELLGSANLDITGTSGIDTLIGNSGNNILDGRQNNDTISGGLGTDTIYGRAGTDNLSGGDGNDTLYGGTGADVLNGGIGTDAVRYDDENYGNLTIRFDNANLSTGAAQGDTFSSIEQVYAGAGNDIIIADGNTNQLFGLGGNDQIWGLAGPDTINGGDGFDYARYDFGVQVNTTVSLQNNNSNTGDAVGDVLISIEGIVAGSGNDTVIGSAVANNLQGNQGNDNLWGLGGADVLIGGDGIDTARYDFGVTGNLVISLIAPGTNTGDAAGDTYNSIENIVGGSGSDTITGNTGANQLSGVGGADTINGHLGTDTLVGGLGTDTFVFSTALDGVNNVDTITDFVVVDDQISLSQSVFTGLSLGTLAASAFVKGTGALDADDRIIYNTANGALLFDVDGVGGTAAIQFATLSTRPGGVTAADFTIIA